ncbi:MAG TPA: ubiquitin-like small modifier protein 1 [Vicinamibacteria bacterium]
MALTIVIPAPLRALSGGQERVTLEPAPPTVGEALAQLWRRHPALRDRVLTEQGEVRPHVNVFLGNESIRYAGGLQARVPDGEVLTILPAVSGGAPVAGRVARAVALLLGPLALAGAARAQAVSSPEVLSALSAQVGASIVRLSLIEGGEERGNGTGFVVRRDGIVVTNHHVVEDADASFVAVFRDGTRRKVLGSLALDEDHDLALLRIEPGDYPALTLADAAAIKVGESVFLIGSSFGLDQSLGTGVVMALRPDGFPEDWKKRYREAGEKIVSGPLVQHTAVSAPGSSGSPVVNLEGKVVAVHHSGIRGTSIYFGAHADALRALLARTDLDAHPTPFGPHVARNLAISAAVFALLATLLFGPGLWDRMRARRLARWRPPAR